MVAKASTKSQGNPLFQRLNPQAKTKTARKVSTRQAKERKDVNPLLARLGNTKSKNITKGKENPLAESIRNGSNRRISVNTSKNSFSVSKGKANKPAGNKVSKPSVKSQQSKGKLKQGPGTVIKIKNSANAKFLSLKNLEYGTSAADLKAALSNIGIIKSVKVKDLHSGSTLAEVEFDEEKCLKEAVKKLNGALADGRILTVNISTVSEI